jgi:hypothetical protein
MQITIENVEHLTLDLGDKPKSPLFTALMASLAATAPTSVSTSDKAAVQTAAPSTKPALKIGEHYAPAGGMYAGISRGEDGQPDGHIFLIDYKPTTKLNWDDAVNWAKSLGDGARLPTKVESALLYANLQGQMDAEDWHWTGTQYSDTFNAWSQDFGDGHQYNRSKTYEARARAVRRLAL